MAETIEEIVTLIQSLKLDNELSNEDFGRTLNEIRNGISELHNYDEAADVAAAIQQTIESKSLIDSEKIRELDETLRQLRIKVDSSADIAQLTEEVRALTENFRSGFNSVTSFADNDVSMKNMLLNKIEDLEKAVKDGAMIEGLRQRTDDLVRGYENFVSDSNLRHGNMVSSFVDLKNKIDDYSSKNNFVFESIDQTINNTNEKISGLEATVSSNLGNVNSKLYTMGDDIQKILNDGFDHLKYLSSNMSEAMNSSSLDVKTTLEVLKANISDFTEHLKGEFLNLNTNLSEKIDTGNNTASVINNDILNNVVEVQNTICAKTNDYENLLNDKVNNIIEFITALQETLGVIKTENNDYFNTKLFELSEKLQEVSTGYERLLVSTTEEIKNVSETVSATSKEIVQSIQSSDNDSFSTIKNDILEASSNNFNAIIERIQAITESVDGFKENTAANLTNYLTSIKDLFTDFSSKIGTPQNNDQIMEKLSNLEILMSRFDIEKNENFEQLQALISKNRESIEALNNIENIINEHSYAKDQKLADIENLIAQFNIEKNENYSQLKNLLEKNSEAIETLNLQTGTPIGLEKIEDLIRENSASKDEKLENLRYLIQEYKESLNRLSEDLNSSQNNMELSGLTELKEILSKQDALNNLVEIIKGNVFECKDNIIQEVQTVKNSIYDISKELNNVQGISDDNAISGKIFELNNQLTEVSQNYEQALSILSIRLEEYVKTAEDVSLSTNIKLDNAIKEFDNINTRFDELGENLNNLVGDSGLIEILANIRQQFNIIFEQIKNEKDGIITGIELSLMDNFENINTSIIQLRQSIEESYEKQLEDFGSLMFNLEAIRRDTASILNNVEKAISERLSEMITEFKPLGEAIKDFADVKYPQSISQIKEQIELSFVTLRSELVDSLNKNNETGNIEEYYKTSIDKLAFLEELVREALNENITTINSTLYNVHDLTQSNLSILEDIQMLFRTDIDNIGNKINESQNAITSSILSELNTLKELISQNSSLNPEELRNLVLPMLDNDELVEVIRGLNKSLMNKIMEFQQENELSAQDILDVINTLKNTADYINETIQENFEKIDENRVKILENINTINSKLDVMVMAIGDNEAINTIKNVDDKIQYIQKEIDSLAKACPDTEEVKNFATKLDLIFAATANIDYTVPLEEIKSDISDLTKQTQFFNKYEELINTINSKIDIIAMGNDIDFLNENIEQIRNSIEQISSELNSSRKPEDIIKTLEEKLAEATSNDHKEMAKNITLLCDNITDIKKDINSTETKLENYLRAMDSTLDVLTSSHEDHQKIIGNLDELKSNIETISNKLDVVSQVDKNSLKLEDLINKLNSKVDILAMSDDSDVLDEIYSIKQLVEEQLETLQASVSDSTNITKLMDALGKIDTSIIGLDFSQHASEIKQAVISAIVAVTNEISFIEEADEIKDYVEEKTNELQRLIMDVKHQLYALTNTSGDMDMYSYTLQDVESDLAKLRLVVNDFANKKSDNELIVMSANLNKMTRAMDDLRNAVIDTEIKRTAKNNEYESLNEQMISISSRLNKLILNNRDADTRAVELSERIEKSLSAADQKLNSTTEAISVVKNVMMYLGEWMDGTTETISSIYDKNTDCSQEIKQLRELLPDNSELLNMIEAKIKKQDERFTELETAVENIYNIVAKENSQKGFDIEELQTIIENKIVKQESRLDRIEQSLDRIVSVLEASDTYMETADRIEKLDDKVSKLNLNIEKLAAYVE